MVFKHFLGGKIKCSSRHASSTTPRNFCWWLGKPTLYRKSGNVVKCNITINQYINSHLSNVVISSSMLIGLYDKICTADLNPVSLWNTYNNRLHTANYHFVSYNLALLPFEPHIKLFFKYWRCKRSTW